MSPASFLLLALTGLSSWVLTGVVRRYALARSVLDIPNERSSHQVPTPRGGGLAIAAAAVVAVLVAGALGWSPASSWVLAVGMVAVAALGWADDHLTLPVRVRMPVQVAIAVSTVYLLGGMPALRLGVHEAPLGALGFVLGVLGVLWSLNLYNFMDGIDGIAAIEALSLGGGGALLLLARGEPGLALLGAVIAASVAGFLPWNWQQARIFMGDVGSATLGYAFAVLALASENGNGLPLLAWVTLYAAFAVDATATVLRRAAAGERVFDAHRQHAYQRLVQAGWSHRRVSSSLLLLNLGLVALAAAGTRWPGMTVPALGAGLLLCAALYGLVERKRPMTVRARPGRSASHTVTETTAPPSGRI